MANFEDYFPGVIDGTVDFSNVNLSFTNVEDENGNEMLELNATSSSVNHVKFTNNTTSNNPKIEAAGDDTNVSLEINPKGTGVVDVGAGADDLKVNGTIVPQAIEVTHGPVAQGDITDEVFFIANDGYEVTDIRVIFSTAESAGTVGIDVERLQSTESPGGNGDSLTGSAADGTATKDTVQQLTVVSDDTQQLSAGDRLGVNFTGDSPGELDGTVITVQLKRI